MAPKKARYGTWKSPISSRMTTESGVFVNILQSDMDPSFSDTVYWNEIHYNEGGRYVVCSSSKRGEVVQWTPEPFNARTLVHEYGGGDFFVYRGVVYFSNFKDQALYRQTTPSSQPEAITDVNKKWRYADGFFSYKTGFIYCVKEDHEVIENGAEEAENTIVAIDPKTGDQSVIASGCDFYSCPRVSPDGSKIAFVQWNHPNMPWDSTTVCVAELSAKGDQISQESLQEVVGGKDASGQDLSVIEPKWTKDNELMYVGDQTDWWNIYHVTANGEHRNVCPFNAELGGPQWMFARASYVFEPNNGSRILTTFKSELGFIDRQSGKYTKIETGFSVHSHVTWTSSGNVYCIASSETKFQHIIQVDMNTLKVSVVYVSTDVPVDIGYFSVANKVSFPTGKDETCYGLYYPPTNKDYQPVEGELPPLLVRAHGGPTGAFFVTLDLKLQYFTSRGFAVLCVDYRGSTGYGKKYRHRLRNQWGVYDVEDCKSGVEYLCQQELVDPNKTCIDGRSAGGFTTLACLAFTDVFKAGVSHFGVTDLAALMRDTHKFESRYLDNLLAPLSKGGLELCNQRSPINHTDKLNCPIAFFQGDEDQIVPPSQAKMMYDAVKAKGLPTAFVLFKGEQHGFRKSENIQACLDGEFYFFGKVLGFEPADQGTELTIENLD